MTLSGFASWLMRCSRYVRDLNAVRRHRVVQRAENRIIGRIVWRGLRRVWR